MALPYIVQFFKPGSPKNKVGPIGKILFWAVVLLALALIIEGLISSLVAVLSLVVIVTILLWLILWYPLNRGKFK